MNSGNTRAGRVDGVVVQSSEVPSSRIRAIFSRVVLHWGFIVRILEASASQLALPIPPPTTVVGALSYSLFKALGLGDLTKPSTERKSSGMTFSTHFDCALEATITAAAGITPSEEPTGICVHQEPSRLSAAPYKTGGSWEDALKSSFGSREFYAKFLAEASPVQAVGAAYGPGTPVDLLWVFDVEQLVKCLKSSMRLDLEVSVVDNVGKIAAYGAVRLGSKEGIQSVETAIYAREDAIRVLHPGEIAITHLYTPTDCVEPIEGVSRISMWDLSYKSREYYLPEPASNSLVISISPERVPAYRVTSPCSAFSIQIDGGKEITAVGLKLYERAS
ncbi:MAG: hypothetical protein RMI56_02580 [Sulfolobales archaeon]|nr:hypothetical protein [Sulfolobales archaeon]